MSRRGGVWSLPWKKRTKEPINYAENNPQRSGVSGLPVFDEMGETLDAPMTQSVQTGFFSSVKAAFTGLKDGTSYSAAHAAVADSMALVSPWLANVVWTINRIFFSLAREAYGGNPVVYACLRLLSAAVAEPPLVPHRLDADENRQSLDFAHPLYKLIRHPNELMTEMSFVEMSVIHMGLVGRCHWWKERDNLNRIIGLWPLRPDRVGPLYAVQPVMAYGYAPYTEQLNTPTPVISGAAKPLNPDNRVLAGWTYWPPGAGTPIRIPRKDVMTINLADPAGETGGLVEGLGPIQVLAREIEADNEATSFVGALLKNSALPGAILNVKSNLMREKAALFKREFKKAFGGTRRGDIAIFDGDTAFQQVGFNMQQLEFPNLRKVSESRVAASLQVPIMLAGFYSGLESANRSTLSEFREYFAETTLPSWWRRIQEQYTYDVASEFDEDIIVTFDTSKVKALLVQAARTIQPYQAAFTEGVLTVNEYRQNVLGLPPLEGPAGNMLYLPSTVLPIDAGSVLFDTIGTGVAANYGTDAPDMTNTLESGDRQNDRPKVPGDKPTATPRLPGSDKPAPDNGHTPQSIPVSNRTTKLTILKGTGLCYTCGTPLNHQAKGFRCDACLAKRGAEDPVQVDVYTRLGESGKPWVPEMKWRTRKTLYTKSEATPEELTLPKIPKAARALVDKTMAQEPEFTGRPERRFLVPSVSLVQQQLEKRPADVRPLRQYDVKTVYYDVPGGSWSNGQEDMPKMRWRQYLEDSGNAFFELKWNTDSVSTKKRIISEAPPVGLDEICIVCYTRTEWETGDLRITLDNDVQTETNATENGTRRLPFYVVEVKGDLPSWLSFLAQYEDEEFSKTKWALGDWAVPPPATKTVYRGFSMTAEELGLKVGQTYVEKTSPIVTSDRVIVEAMLKGTPGTLFVVRGVPADFSGASLPHSKLRIISTTPGCIEAEIVDAA